MKLGLKYYAQYDKWSCGAISLKMLLEHVGIKEGRKRIIKLVGVKPYTGSENEGIINAIKKYDLEILEKDKTKVSEVVNYIKSGYPVLVNYFNPITQVGHYSVINGYNSKEELLYFLDPRNGQDYTLSYKEFDKLWHNMKGDIKKWALIIGRERIVLNKK